MLPDVNLFLQCRSIKDLPWKDLAEAGPIVIYVSRTVQREIDNLKGDGKQRRSQRAREISSYFKQMRGASNRTIVLQASNPRVETKFLPRLDPQRSKPQQLDYSKPDDCHVEEALAFRAVNPEQRTVLLTHDSNMLLTADDVELECIEIPDSWLLAPEKDDQQKKIDELNAKVRLLERQFPQLAISAEDEQRAPIQMLSLSIVEYDPPSSAQIQSVLSDLRGRFPRQENFEKQSVDEQWLALPIAAQFRKYRPPEPREIERYNQDYDTWLKAAEAFLGSLGQRLTERKTVIEAGFQLENSGMEPARSVLIEFVATSGFLLKPLSDDDRLVIGHMKLPKCPEPPSGKYIDTLNPLADFNTMTRRPVFQDSAAVVAGLMPRQLVPDPDEFYHTDRRPQDFVERMSLTCMRYRHQLEPRHFGLVVQWNAEKRTTSGAIRCRVSADNLPKPIEHILPIKVAFERGDISTEIERYRPSKPKISGVRMRARPPDDWSA